MSWNLREAVVTYRKGVRVSTERALRSSRDIASLVQSAPEGTDLALLTCSAAERFVVVGLDAKNRVIAYHTVGIGGGASVAVDLPAVFRFLIAACALRFVVLHNHPSGEVTPSSEDIALTERLQRAGELLGLQLLDHLIVTDTADYFSFLDAGMLTRRLFLIPRCRDAHSDVTPRGVSDSTTLSLRA